MQLQRNAWWLAQLPKLSWGKWIKSKRQKISGITEPKIYSSPRHKYNGTHLEHLQREFNALGWHEQTTKSEARIMSSVQHIIEHIVANWESAETAFHILDISTRILKYQLLSPLMGDKGEFNEPDEHGNERNNRNPVVKRCTTEGKEKYEDFLFAALVTVWPDGTRMVDPGGFGGIPLLAYPVNPNSAHVILRETMADPNQGEVVQPIFDGCIYHLFKNNVNKDGMPFYSLNKKDSKKI